MTRPRTAARIAAARDLTLALRLTPVVTFAGLLLCAGATTARAASAQIRIHYQNNRQGPLALRGSGAGLRWDRNVILAPTPDAGSATTVATVDDPSFVAPIEFKPLLLTPGTPVSPATGERWAIGPNFVLRPGERVDVYPRFYEPRGRVELLFGAFASDILGNTRRIWAYLPPSYFTNPDARFPVLYMHDGQNLFDPARAFLGRSWHVDDAINEHGSAGDRTIRDVIVIGIESGADRLYEMTPTTDPTVDPKMGRMGGADRYLAMIVRELKPRVDAALRTMPEMSAMGGSSLGGLVTIAAGNRYPGLFALLALSPSSWYDGSAERTETERRLAALPPEARPPRVYLDAGTIDDSLADTARYAEVYRALGYADGTSFLFVTGPNDAHDEWAWSGRVVDALRFLFHD